MLIKKIHEFNHYINANRQPWPIFLWTTFILVLLEICHELSHTVISFLFIIIKSAKKLLLPPKYEIIMLPSNHSFFQYCDSNVGLFSNAPCKVITLNPFCILFGISCRSFLFLKAAKRLSLLFANAFKSVQEQQLLLSQ